MVSGNLYVLEFLGPYILMRAYIVSAGEFRAFIRWFQYATLVVILLAVVDHLTASYWIVNKAAALVHAQQLSPQFRGGLLRGQSIFDHPILFGTYCAFAGVILYFAQSSVIKSLFWFVICGIGCFLAQSSAPLLALILGICVILYDRVMRQYPGRWKLLLSCIVCFIVGLFIVSDKPMSFLIRNFTLDPQTGYYRILIWQFGGDEVLRSPLFGIGFRDWVRASWMGGSVDTLWLGLAMNYGIPTAVLFGMVLISATRGSRQQQSGVANDFLDQIRLSLSIVISLTIFVCFTVAFWGTMWSFLGALAGLRTNCRREPHSHRIPSRSARSAAPHAHRSAAAPWARRRSKIGTAPGKAMGVTAR